MGVELLLGSRHVFVGWAQLMTDLGVGLEVRFHVAEELFHVNKNFEKQDWHDHVMHSVDHLPDATAQNFDLEHRSRLHEVYVMINLIGVWSDTIRGTTVRIPVRIIQACAVAMSEEVVDVDEDETEVEEDMVSDGWKSKALVQS
ncbi:uncharacterized protein G2W53_021796 [Senna tora]|uniref:Uncharacterized protein n=1 Tax=Senna tora TaxID=362788 RepID=A0A834TLM7_9FABA|nr:uncharacterized protein G2W53_021796 [Senna tora]